MSGTIGELPADDDAPPQVVQHAYQSYLVARPDRSRFALLTRHADRAEIHGADGRTLAVVPGPLGFTPVYEVRTVGGGPSMTSGEDLRFGYIDAAATDERIYGLFSGRARRDCPGCASLGTRLRVLDWDGRVKGAFKLDAYLLGIAVSPDGRTVYGARVEPTPAIVRYRLPDVP